MIKDKNKELLNNKEMVDAFVQKKLDYAIILKELDCINNKLRSIKEVVYNDEGKIIEDKDFTKRKMEQVLPDTMESILLRKVCK